MKRLLTLTVGLSLACLTVACGEQPLDPDIPGIAAAEGGEPGPPPGKGPPPGTPIPPGAGPPFLSTYAVAAGNRFSCALQTSLAYCWGSNGLGRLGDGTTTNSPNPVAVAGGRRYTALAVGDTHSCALKPDGTAWCWGSNIRGELGAGLPAGFTEFSSVPVEVAGGHSFVAIAAGLRLTCGITSGGAAYCWGLNGFGQLGDGTTTDSNVPVAVDTNLAFESITVDVFKACGLAAGGTAYCWGRSSFGDFGNGIGGIDFFPAPVQAADGLSLSSINAGVFYACGVDASGTALCWGDDRSIGKLGRGTLLAGNAPETLVPAPVVGGLTFESISLDLNNKNTILGHTCGVTTSGDAYCWGSNSTGQLGGPSSEACEFSATMFDCSSSPVLVQGGISFTEIAVGIGAGTGPFGEHTCGLAEDGSVYCWGANAAGQLGDGTFTDSSTPVLVNLP